MRSSFLWWFLWAPLSLFFEFLTIFGYSFLAFISSTHIFSYPLSPRSPRPSPVSNSLKGLRTEHTVLLTGKMYDSKRKASEQNQQRERHMGWKPEAARIKLPSVLSPWRCTGRAEFPLYPPISPPPIELWQACRVCPPGELHRGSVRGALPGGWFRRAPLPSMYQNRRLAEGNQVFSRSRIVCTSSCSTLSPSCLGKVL